jgi:hypothetical protein
LKLFLILLAIAAVIFLITEYTTAFLLIIATLVVTSFVRKSEQKKSDIISTSKDKPEIKTALYLHFIETAIESYQMLNDEEHVYIFIFPCDNDGNRNGDIKEIQFSCTFEDTLSFTSSHLKENVWPNTGIGYRISDGLDSNGMNIDGFTAWARWGLYAFVDDKQYPNYRDYSYILQYLGEYTTNIKGIKNIRPIDSSSWRKGFFVHLERNPTEETAEILFNK